MRVSRIIAAAALVVASGCPKPLSLECRPCGGDSECAPQGLACVNGWCEGATPCLPALAVAADAGLVFEDDFESRALVVDAGRWDEVKGPTTDQVATVTDAGLSGWSFALFDNGSTNGDFGRFVEKRIEVTDTSLHVRSWLWLSANGGPTGPHAVLVYGTVPASTLAEALLRDGAIKGKCADRTRQAEGCGGVDGTWKDSTWHLIELSMEGLGSANGRCVLRADGVELCSMPRDYTGVTTYSLTVSATSMDERWIGELRADDVAVTTGVRAPGRVELVLGTQGLTEGLCTPVRVELRTGDDAGVLSAAVRRLELGLDGGSGTFHAQGCRGPALTKVSLERGQTSVDVAYRPGDPAPAEATVMVEDRGRDLAPAVATWPVAR